MLIKLCLGSLWFEYFMSKIINLPTGNQIECSSPGLSAEGRIAAMIYSSPFY